MVHQSDDAFSARMRNILDTANRLKEVTSVSDSLGTPSRTGHSSTVVIDSIHLPSPRPLLPLLLSSGASHEIATAADKIYELRAEELRRHVQESIIAAGHQIAESPVVASASSPDLLIRKFVLTATEVYLRRLRQWRDEIVLRVKQSCKSPIDNTAPRKNFRTFNPDYVPLLERFFEEDPFPTHADKTFLAEKSNMEYRQIHVWFQNRRNRTKRESKPLRKKPVYKGTARSLERPHKHTNDHMADSDCRVPRSSRIKMDPLRGTTKTVITQNKVSNDDLVSSSPFHAYPSRYPPACPYDPFPCKSGPANFSRPQWRRTACNKPPLLFPTSIDDLVEKFSQLNVRDETRSRGSPKLQAHTATAAITIIPSRAPHPSLIIPTYHQPADVQRHPIVRAPVINSRVFQSPGFASKPVTLVSQSISLDTNELLRERMTTPLPRYFPYRTQNAHRDTTPSENSLTFSSSYRLCSPDSECHSCSSSISSPLDITSDQGLPPFGSPCRSPFDSLIHSHN